MKTEYKVGDKVIAVTNSGYYIVSPGDELEVVVVLSCGCNCRVKNGNILFFSFRDIKPTPKSVSQSLINAIKSMPGVMMVSITENPEALIVEFEEEKPIIEDGIYVSLVGTTLRVINGDISNSFNDGFSGFKFNNGFSGFRIGLYTIEDFHKSNFTPANDKQRADHMQAEIDNGFWNKLNK